ncbi:ABC transporter ATP-binding protein [Acidisoma cellulosilytica]|uniref:ABC transporter ATP-binding protein n=1 Tax=Acidisoma cellulosilyticum TaxID=2802395 RepID=A0A963Z009_9PROT|nr:ABC transporter ATP-binding protein [Acidisoma cellulosilyticum]MCB8879507.1 ABC transporter ATP-binding protein [Acidisoma cellulosilyticum]
MPTDPFLTLTGITKAFVPGHPVLDNVTVTVRRGEIHAILGENGAGKSTLLNILFGMYQPDMGGILLEGREVIHRSPADAIANRIGMVHQHFKLVPTFTVAENLRLAAPPAIRPSLARNADIARLADSFGLAIDPKAIVSTLPLYLQQRVEILKALINRAELILFDEPTTILNPAEIDAFYKVLQQIAAEGRAVVVVTHHLNEVTEHAQHASVIRRGQLISSGPVAGRAREDFVRDMVGHEVDLSAALDGTGEAPGPVRLALHNVSVAATPSSSGLRDTSLTLRAGEVVGIAGVEGNGQRELFELVAGTILPDSGRVEAGRTHADGRPRAGLVPEDRHQEGLVLDLPIAINLLLNKIDEAPYARAGRLNHAAITARAEEMRAASDVRSRNVHVTPRILSGGNQQKIVLARAMNEDADIIAVYQPTRGLDVAASEEILRRLRDAANGGRAVLFISSNLDEIMRISDRIIIVYAGRAVGELDGRASRAEIGALMTGGAAH